MEHVWTEEARKREGQLPLLPEHSAVVFDEGHLLEFAAQKALTYRVKQSTLEMFLERLLGNDIREEFAELVEEALRANDEFFGLLSENAEKAEGSERMRIKDHANLKKRPPSCMICLKRSGRRSFLKASCTRSTNTL